MLQDAAPSCRYHRTFPRTTGRPGAADAAVDSAGAAVPFKGLRAGMDPPDGYKSTQQQADDMTTRPSGSGPTSQSNARDFGPKLLHADRPTGLGPGSQVTGISDFLLCNASVLTIGAEASASFELQYRIPLKQQLLRSVH